MYKEINANKRKTWILILVFCVLVIAPWAVYGAMSGIDTSSQIIGATLIATIYSLISYFFADKVALLTNGAKQIQKQDAPELWNVIENLCIANGQPIPKVYIIDDPSPNAFATGRKPETSSIAFTTGLLRILNKQELEGVAAHELSHIRNYDIRVMTIVVVLVGAVMLIADIMLRSMIFKGGDRDRNGNIAIVLAFVGLALSILTPILAQIIQFAVSRSREYLADASGALLTRYPEGLASALEKISAHAGPGLQRANHATAHMFIANPFGKKHTIANLFASHPPAAERIARLRNMGR